jgi:hypothetical protein
MYRLQCVASIHALDLRIRFFFLIFQPMQFQSIMRYQQFKSAVNLMSTNFMFCILCKLYFLHKNVTNFFGFLIFDKQMSSAWSHFYHTCCVRLHFYRFHLSICHQEKLNFFDFYTSIYLHLFHSQCRS